MEDLLPGRRSGRSSSNFGTFVPLAALGIAIVALVIGAISLSDFNSRDKIKIANGPESALTESFSLEASSTTVVVVGCTNNTISPTNEIFSDGTFLWANNCPLIEDNVCQEHVCLGDGSCARRTIAGSECSMTEQCEETFGPGYVCNITSCLCEVMVPVNGSMYTNSLVCSNNGTMSVVMVMDAECPTPDQVLTAIDSNSADWRDPIAVPAEELQCDEDTISIANSSCPSDGDVLIADGSGAATWGPVLTIIDEGSMYVEFGGFLEDFYVDYTYVGIGRQRTLQWYQNLTTCNGFQMFATPPASVISELQPRATWAVGVFDQNPVPGVVRVDISVGTRLLFSPGFAFGNFGGTGACGLAAGSISWINQS